MKEAFKKIKERLEEEIQYQQRNTDETPAVYKMSHKQARQKMRECYEHAIEIVNQVAKEYENDCCVWKGKRVFDPYKSSCGQKSIVNPYWGHCPYCGKKIVVVDQL